MSKAIQPTSNEKKQQPRKARTRQTKKKSVRRSSTKKQNRTVESPTPAASTPVVPKPATPDPALPSPSIRPTESEKPKTLVKKEEKADPAAKSEFSKGATPIQAACRKWIASISKKGLRGVREEWQYTVKKIKSGLSTDDFLATENLTKNRFDDVVCLDKSRVRVKINPDKDDYIHASWVEIRKDLQYICSQGPLVNTIAQFWLMCFQEEAKVILQLCQNIEDGKDKCADYLPSADTEVWAEFGPVKVKTVEPSAPVPNAQKVSKTVVTVKFEEKEITVVHLLYSGWPDHSAADVSTIREIRSLVQKLYEKKPIIAHCSAGIGRTGCFVAIEMALSKLMVDLDGSFSVVDLIRTLREQREKAIQNDKQYCFIYRCVIDILVAEEALSKSTEVTTFITAYEDYMNRKKKTVARKKASSDTKLTEEAAEK